MKRIINAFKYSMAGLTATWKSEPAFRQDIVIFVVGTIVAIILPVTLFLKACMISALLLIVIMELINTAIETIVDRISMDRHELSKKAKDIGSALVCIAFINAAIMWILILIQCFA